MACRESTPCPCSHSGAARVYAAQTTATTQRRDERLATLSSTCFEVVAGTTPAAVESEHRTETLVCSTRYKSDGGCIPCRCLRSPTSGPPSPNHRSVSARGLRVRRTAHQRWRRSVGITRCTFRSAIFISFGGDAHCCTNVRLRRSRLLEDVGNTLGSPPSRGLRSLLHRLLAEQLGHRCSAGLKIVLPALHEVDLCCLLVGFEGRWCKWAALWLGGGRESCQRRRAASSQEQHRDGGHLPSGGRRV